MLIIFIPDNFYGEFFCLDLFIPHDLVVDVLCSVISDIFSVLLDDIRAYCFPFRKGNFVVEYNNAQFFRRGDI